MQYLQKNSPYIEEVSRHLNFLVEIRMFEKWKTDVLGNATMCNTKEQEENPSLRPAAEVRVKVLMI